MALSWGSCIHKIWVPISNGHVFVTLALVTGFADVNDEKWFELASNVFTRRTATHDTSSDWVEL